ncbi:hypothetical protein B0H14DRAFT_2616635 [Mycena olivaceomarginata]|nr:hypothetical protein B0H14DRAFT_2616635 [Mycena olivaceomarginata]
MMRKDLCRHSDRKVEIDEIKEYSGIMMLPTWLQAAKPRSPSRGLTSQAKPNPRLWAGLGLGLGWLKPKPKAQATAWRGQNDITTLISATVPSAVAYTGKITRKPWLKPKPSQAKPSPPRRLGLGLEESEAKAWSFQAQAGVSRPSQAVTSLPGKPRRSAKPGTQESTTNILESLPKNAWEASWNTLQMEKRVRKNLKQVHGSVHGTKAELSVTVCHKWDLVHEEVHFQHRLPQQFTCEVHGPRFAVHEPVHGPLSQQIRPLGSTTTPKAEAIKPSGDGQASRTRRKRGIAASPREKRKKTQKRKENMMKKGGKEMGREAILRHRASFPFSLFQVWRTGSALRRAGAA